MGILILRFSSDFSFIFRIFFCSCWHFSPLPLIILFDASGRKLHANAEESNGSDELTDPPKVEEKIGAVPGGLSTDSDVVKRLIPGFSLRISVFSLLTRFFCASVFQGG